VRPTLILGLSVLAILLCIAGGLTWNAVLWRSGWFKKAPEIAKGLPAFAGSESRPWTRRLNQTFPIGSREAPMLAALHKQGFVVDPTTRHAAYGWAVFPCVYTLTVTWRADELGRVRAVQGGLLNACTDPKYLLPETRGRGFRPRPQAPAPAPDPSLVPTAQSA